MTLPVIPGIDPSVGQNLAELAHAVGSALKPQLEFDTALRNALATHPELIQQIGDLQKRSPEAVRRLYGPHAADYFAAVTQSPEDRASAARGTLQATLDTNTNAGIANLPAPVRDAQVRAGAERALSGGLSSVDVQQQERAGRTLAAFNQFVTSNATATPQEIVSKIRNRDPEITPDIAEGAFQSPLYAKLLSDASESDRIALSERLANARDARAVERSRDLTIETTARQLMLKSNSSNLPAWIEVVRNGQNSADVLKARAKEQDKRTPEEQALIDAADNLERMNVDDRRQAVLPVLNTIRQSAGQVNSILASRTLSAEEKSNQLSAITTSLNSAYSAAGLPIKAHYTPYEHHWLSSNQKPAITYTRVGPDGKETPISDAEVNAAVNVTEAGGPPAQASIDPLVAAAINAIRNNQASLSDVETATKYTPAQKAAIRAAFATGR